MYHHVPFADFKGCMLYANLETIVCRNNCKSVLNCSWNCGFITKTLLENKLDLVS